jgi:sugar phosphate isomerase/epimerase
VVELLAADWNHWPDRLSPAEIVQTAAAAGVDGLELGVYDTHVELAPTRLEEWRRLGDEYGIPVRMLLYSMPAERWPHGGLSSEPDHARLFQQVEHLLDLATSLGLDTVGLWPGADLPGADRASFVAAISRIAELAVNAGARIAIEPKPGTLITSVDDLVAAITETSTSEHIGALLDTGHEHAAGRDPAPIAHTLGDQLLHVHLGDSDGDPDADLPPGRLHPLDPFLTALDSISYAGAMSPDVYGAVASHSVTGAAALAETVRHVNAHGTGRRRS